MEQQTFTVNNVRQIAASKGIRLTFLARRIGVSPQLFNWKLNTNNVTTLEREAIAQALGVGVGEVFPEAVAEVVES